MEFYTLTFLKMSHFIPCLRAERAQECIPQFLTTESSVNCRKRTRAEEIEWIKQSILQKKDGRQIQIYPGKVNF